MTTATMPRLAKSKPLTDAQKRVAIAKDVIKQLRVVTAKRHVYIEVPETVSLPAGEDMQKYLKKIITKKCRVCAKGACLLSKVRLFDNVNLPFILNDDKFCSDNLSEFTGEQLKLIECAFEGWYECENFHPFLKAFPDNNKRMTLIMKNIIKNKGTLVPKQLLGLCKE